MEYWIRTARILLGLLAVSVQAMADTVVFPTDIPDFQDAVSSVSPGDTVLIEPGSWDAGYTFLPSGITVASVSGDPYTTSLVGHLHVHDRDGIVLRGFRLSYGSSAPAIACVSSEILFEEVQLAYCGRIALYCEDSDITFRSGLFYENAQGVRAVGSHLDLEDVGFRYNGHERSGAGLYALGCDVTMTRCRFSHNETGSFDYTHTWWAYVGKGGGAYLRETSLTATDVVFDSNHTWQAGAGLALIGEGTYADISGGSFTDNTTSTDISSDGALQKGAALFVDGATVTLDGVWFSGNWCNRDGGAVYCGGGASVAVMNCIFVENSAVHQGGAICGPADVSNCTFVDNAASSGSAAYASQARPTMYNSILCCTPEAVSTVGVFLTRCCRWSSALDGEDGERDNINADPLFCNYEARDLTLCEDSPCLPDNNDWGELVGALGAGCGPCDTAVHEMSWGRIKAMYRGCE